MPYHKHLTGVKAKDYALNPIARAVAREKLRRAILDQKIKVYLMEDDEDCAEFCEGIGLTLAVIGYASELDPKIDQHDSTLKVLRGGLSACQQMLTTGKWKKINAVAIDVALDAAMVLNRDVKADYINTAWHNLTGANTS
jgi:hypothetical protein